MRKGLNFSYKTAADWLDWPYNRIPDWLFLNANDGSDRQTKISRWLQEYEGCLSAAIKYFLFMNVLVEFTASMFISSTLK